VLCPLRLIRLDIVDAEGQFRCDFTRQLEGGLDDDVKEADLRLRYVCIFTVEELTHREAVYLLQVTLLEELYEEQVTPMFTEVPRLGWIRNISQMEHDLGELVFEFDVAHVELLAEHVAVELTNGLEVVRHVRSKDGTNHLSSDLLVGFRVEMPHPVDLLLRGHQFETSRDVVVLEHTLIIVSNGCAVAHLCQEDVVDTGMLVVVATGRNQVRHQLDLVELTEGV